MNKLAAAALVGTMLATSPAWAYDDLIVFGDSLSDVGNAFGGTGGTLPASPPNYFGRLSNGPLWVEYLAPKLGLPSPTPALAAIPALFPVPHPTDYAVALAPVVKPAVPPPPPLSLLPAVEDQVTTYIGTKNPTGNELFVLWGGSNDFFGGQADPNAPADKLRDLVAALAADGARHFLVLNLPALGQTPGHRGKVEEVPLDLAALAFNARLAADLSTLGASLPQIDVKLFDVHALYAEMQANPAAYGLTNATAAALTTVGADPNTYLFWDDVHPTTRVHSILADQVAAAIPEPMSAAGLLLVVTAGMRRRRT